MTTPLTLPIEGLDSDALLQEWRWVVSGEFRPFQLSAFGDWFFLAPDESIHRLDLIEGELTQIARSMTEFTRLSLHEDNLAQWYLDGFVLQCNAAGLHLDGEECFGWRVHPMMGGEFAVENIQKVPLKEYQCQVGRLLRTLRGLP